MALMGYALEATARERQIIGFGLPGQGPVSTRLLCETPLRARRSFAALEAAAGGAELCLDPAILWHWRKDLGHWRGLKELTRRFCGLRRILAAHEGRQRILGRNRVMSWLTSHLLGGKLRPFAPAVGPKISPQEMVDQLRYAFSAPPDGAHPPRIMPAHLNQLRRASPYWRSLSDLACHPAIFNHPIIRAIRENRLPAPALTSGRQLTPKLAQALESGALEAHLDLFSYRKRASSARDLPGHFSPFPPMEDMPPSSSPVMAMPEQAQVIQLHPTAKSLRNQLLRILCAQAPPESFQLTAHKAESTPFIALMALACHAPCLAPGLTPAAPPSPDLLQGWYARHVTPYFAHLAFTSQPASSPISGGKTADMGLHLIGHGRKSTGLGANLHMSADAMHLLGLTPIGYDYDYDFSSLELHAAPDRSLRARSKNTHADMLSCRLRRPVALHHLNADKIPQSMLAAPFAHARDVYHIGYLLWELERLPESHHLALSLLDEIWVPSHFVARSYAAYCAANGLTVQIRMMGKGLALPPPSAAPKRKTGHKLRALIAFDAHSGVARKNPLAAAHAFQSAFPRSVDVALTIKTTPLPEAHWGDPENQMAQLRQIAARDPRITLIENKISQKALHRMIASHDLFISTHRAEGFGLLPAYALAQGVPVLVTDFGGVQDFCTTQTAHLLPSKRISVPSDLPVFGGLGADWAEVDRDALSAALRAFAQNPAPFRAQAQRGRSLIRQSYHPLAYARKIRDAWQDSGLLEPNAPDSASNLLETKASLPNN